MKNLHSLDLLAASIAALAHDVGHPALTNRYLVNNKDRLAIQYNDTSVLENMHCSLTFTLMNKTNCNVLEPLSLGEFTNVRKMIIEMIMETDMSKHFEILSKFRTRATVLSDLNLGIHEDKCTVLAMGLKCADIGHTAKENCLHLKWTELVCEEFFNQGDLEKSKKQSVSMYCDRNNSDVPKSQAGFIKNICLPLYELWCKYLDSDVVNGAALMCLKGNLSYWEAKVGRRRESVMALDIDHSQ